MVDSVTFIGFGDFSSQHELCPYVYSTGRCESGADFRARYGPPELRA
jgi:hypothetical protein